MRVDDLIPFIVPLSMFWFGGDHTLFEAFKLFAIIVLSSGLELGFIAVNAGHHHPEVYHDGDPVRFVLIVFCFSLSWIE